MIETTRISHDKIYFLGLTPPASTATGLRENHGKHNFVHVPISIDVKGTDLTHILSDTDFFPARFSGRRWNYFNSIPDVSCFQITVHHTVAKEPPKRYGGFPKKRGPNHPFYWDFPWNKPSSYWGTPIDYGTPHIYIYIERESLLTSIFHY